MLSEQSAFREGADDLIKVKFHIYVCVCVFMRVSFHLNAWKLATALKKHWHRPNQWI